MDKQNKYDRQLRLWAASGQNSLENSHVCLLNASVLGSEAMKNLILPGVGEFTVIDDRIVGPQEAQGGFFLGHSDIGLNSSIAMVENLSELNPDTAGYSETRSIEQLLQDEEDSYWQKFQLVVLTERHRYTTHIVDKLKDILWRLDVPLLIADSMGFYGYVRVIAREITVVETHPESLIDLRVDQPWDDLQAYCDSVDLIELDNTDHAHVPYVVILVKALQEWKRQKGTSPNTYEQKQQFKRMISDMSRDLRSEANFEEAYNSAWRASQVTTVPAHITELLEDIDSQPGNLKSVFWVYICALRRFLVKNNGLLPLSGVLPDMASDTERYVELQAIYREKAAKDQAALRSEIEEVLESESIKDVESRTGEASELTGLILDDESIKTFCKSCRFLYVARGSRADFTSDMVPDGLLAIYYAVINVGIFSSNKGRIPQPGDLELITKGAEISEEYRKIIEEILAHYSIQYHNVCSYMGGIVGQEALKLVTRQYRPLDNLYVYDGVHCLSEKWKI
ncbi:NEDD8-activating enzyme E1 regulatory subunit [[Candida] anglica]|uniref:NEDD8-activating enzyme E1 regulatory subunit n=1 Tax=[Candida] anglica TaxID=148631 RepID=A0ABP0E7N2_9ASCO